MHCLAEVSLAFSCSSGKQNKGMEIAHQFPFIWRPLTESGLTSKEKNLSQDLVRPLPGPQSPCVQGGRQMLIATQVLGVGFPACVPTQTHRTLVKGLCPMSGRQ